MRYRAGPARLAGFWRSELGKNLLLSNVSSGDTHQSGAVGPGTTAPSRRFSPLTEDDRQGQRPQYQGVNCFQCPSETTSTVPSVTLIAV